MSSPTYVLRGEEDELFWERPQPLALALGKHLVSGHKHRVEVRDCAARGQNGVASLEANYVAHPLEHKVFHENENGRNLVGEPSNLLWRHFKLVSFAHREVFGFGFWFGGGGGHLHVGVGGRSEPLAGQRDDVQSVAQLVEEVRVSWARRAEAWISFECAARPPASDNQS